MFIWEQQSIKGIFDILRADFGLSEKSGNAWLFYPSSVDEIVTACSMLQNSAITWGTLFEGGRYKFQQKSYQKRSVEYRITCYWTKSLDMDREQLKKEWSNIAATEPRVVDSYKDGCSHHYKRKIQIHWKWIAFLEPTRKLSLQGKQLPWNLDRDGCM